MKSPRLQKQLTGACAILLTLALGAATAVLVACGGSGAAGLIPAASAGPLQSDFEAVAQAAQSGNGNCLGTESALGKTEQDFLALPASVDAGLRKRLREGIANLRKVALAMCAQPSPGATTATTPSTTTQTTTTGTQTAPSVPTATQTTPTVTAPESGSGNSGGTPAEGGASEEGPGKGKGKGEGDGKGEGAAAGGASPED